MAILKSIFVIHTTSKDEDANTDASFDLIASRPDTDFIQAFPNHPHDEREKDRTDEYEFDVEGEGIDSDTTEITMFMRSTTNGWLPRTMWVLGVTERDQVILLGGHPEWNKGWFDRGDDTEAHDKHIISN